MSATRAELLQSCKKQEAVAGYGECRLPRNRFVRPDLGVTNANSIFLLAVVYLDLPPVEIALQQSLGLV